VLGLKKGFWGEETPGGVGNGREQEKEERSSWKAKGLLTVDFRICRKKKEGLRGLYGIGLTVQEGGDPGGKNKLER